MVAEVFASGAPLVTILCPVSLSWLLPLYVVAAEAISHVEVTDLVNV